jgi:hypothetical protein
MSDDDYTPITDELRDVAARLSTLRAPRGTDDVPLPGDGPVHAIKIDEMPDDLKAALVHALTGDEWEQPALTPEQDARVSALFHARSVILQEEPGRPFGSTGKRVDVDDLLRVAKYIVDGVVQARFSD